MHNLITQNLIKLNIEKTKWILCVWLLHYHLIFTYFCLWQNNLHIVGTSFVAAYLSHYG
jgi:hypothetical protein